MVEGGPAREVRMRKKTITITITITNIIITKIIQISAKPDFD